MDFHHASNAAQPYHQQQPPMATAVPYAPQQQQHHQHPPAQQGAGEQHGVAAAGAPWVVDQQHAAAYPQQQQQQQHTPPQQLPPGAVLVPHGGGVPAVLPQPVMSMGAATDSHQQQQQQQVAWPAPQQQHQAMPAAYPTAHGGGGGAVLAAGPVMPAYPQQHFAAAPAVAAAMPHGHHHHQHAAPLFVPGGGMVAQTPVLMSLPHHHHHHQVHHHHHHHHQQQQQRGYGAHYQQHHQHHQHRGGPVPGNRGVGAPAAPASLVTPLRTLVTELATGLVQRDLSSLTSTVPTPIAADRLQTLVDHTYRAFATDRDLMMFVKEHYPLELCLQLRDMLVAQHEKNAMDPSTSVSSTSTGLARDLLDRRGVLVVSLIEVLSTIASEKEEDPTAAATTTTTDGGDSERSGSSKSAKVAAPSASALTAFCPLVSAILSIFDVCVGNARGCIALLRLCASTLGAPRVVDSLVARITDALGRLVFDPHANYLVSHVICSCRRATTTTGSMDDPRRFTALQRDEMIARTPTILALTNAKGGKQMLHSTAAPTAPRMALRAEVHHAVWDRFTSTLIAILAQDVVRACTHREASHIVEHVMREFTFSEISNAEQLLRGMAYDVHTVLLRLAQHPCGRHCVCALAEAVAVRAHLISRETLDFCLQQLNSLRDVVHATGIPISNFDQVDVAIARAAVARMPPGGAATAEKPQPALPPQQVAPFTAAVAYDGRPQY